MKRFLLLLSTIFLFVCTGCGEDAERTVQGQNAPEQNEQETVQGQSESEQGVREQDESEQIGQETAQEQDAVGQSGSETAREQDVAEQSGSETAQGQDTSEQSGPAQDGSEDAVLITTEASLADGRALTLAVVGKKISENFYGVSEVRVYDGDVLIQTVFVADAIAAYERGTFLSEDPEGIQPDGSGELSADERNELPEYMKYTECWSIEDTIAVLDFNFDGNADFGLFGWVPNNTIPYYYWAWDEAAGQYAYVFTLQGVEVHPEAGEVSAGYKSGAAGSQHTTDYFVPDGDGELYMVRREILDWKQSADGERPALEIWVPRDGVEISARAVSYSGLEDELVLVRREIPTAEVHDDNTVSYFTEIWELRDGTLQLTGREEFGCE
ncbi:MAG: hypothetical protein NC409_00555 [Clostridium sp.]|nr:hypothetical protein [Clostridium sp.]